MPTENYVGPVGELRAASTAGTGTALTTTAAFIELPNGTFLVRIQPRNQTATTVAVRIALNPYLEIIKSTDLLATTANATDGSVNCQDALTSTTLSLSAFNTIAATNALYIGSHLPFRGARVVMDGANVNAVASVLTVKYWKNTPAWTAVAGLSDGTASAGATFAQTGTISWTVPTDWLPAALSSNFVRGTAGIGETAVAIPYSNVPLYWTRWEVSAQLSAGTAVQTIVSANRSTAYWDIPVYLAADNTSPSQQFDFLIEKGPFGVGCVEALTQASTANLVVDCATRPQEGFTSGLS